MSYNWVDAVLVMVALLYAWQAYERGVIAVLNEMVAWVAAWLVGAEMYEPITRFLVINLGLKAASVRPWSLLLTVLVVQILVYRLMEWLTRKLPRHFYGKAMHFIIGVIPALVCGICFAGFVLLILIALPFKFPFKADLIGSAAAQELLPELPMINVQ